MRFQPNLGGRTLAGLLVAATVALGVIPSPEALPPPSGDLTPAVARQEFCAAVIEADGRTASARLVSSAGAGADFALRNDGFRSTWLLSVLRQADPARDWRARLDSLEARLPADRSSPGLARAYGDCLAEQNRDPAFTAALHAYLPYTDAP